jgi:hypothetical protein
MFGNLIGIVKALDGSKDDILWAEAKYGCGKRSESVPDSSSKDHNT